MILRFFFVRPILLSGGLNAVKCKAKSKYGWFDYAS
uniref:Uncharacterized protein n=1 Tax=Myoviridae sp. ct7CH26 TaxID=2827604 RepID=A0A8S5RSY2_9CAUD|nr:MAG TPA: hypothetical protein [Myoviridae sp. ct7CH26]